MICTYNDQCFICHSWCLDSCHYFCQHGVRLFHGFIVFRTSVTIFMSAVIHMIKMDKSEGGLFVFYISTCQGCCFILGIRTYIIIHGTFLEQPSKPGPMINSSNFRIFLLVIYQLKDAGKKKILTLNNCRQNKIVFLPAIWSNSMLLRPRTHNHGSPVGTGTGWQNRPGVHAWSPFTYYLIKGRSCCFFESIGA